MPTISPARSVRSIASSTVTPRASRRPMPSASSAGAARAAARPCRAEPHLAPDHQLGELLARGLGGAALRHHRAVAHHVDRVGQRHDLAQLVRDQDHRGAAVAQRAQDVEQLVGLLRRQHRGRLVEDQDAGAAIQRLQDLDALLLADRQVADQRVRVDAQRVFAAEPLDLGARGPRLCSQQRARLGAEHDVLQHREGVDQHEVLVHHADAGVDRVARVADRDRLAVDEDLAAVGLVEAVQDAHQRRLAGAVLADDAVIEPRATVSDTSRLACTAPNDLSIARSATAGGRRGFDRSSARRSDRRRCCCSCSRAP